MEKAPYSRGEVFVGEAMRKYEGWLAVQDFPETIVRSAGGRVGVFGGGGGAGAVRREGSGNGGGVSPSASAKKATQRLAMTSSFGSLPNLNSNSSLAVVVAPQMTSSRVLRRPPSGDDIFVMDVNEPSPPTATLDVPSSSLSLSMGVAQQASPPVWKAHGVPRYERQLFLCRCLPIIST